MSNGKRGRPLGFRLTEESKRAISNSKRGQRHKMETKDKISRSLILYFRKQNPLSEEIINSYCRIDDDDMCEWVSSVQEELDNCFDIRTEKSMNNTRKMEMSYGHNIEFFSHSITPELLYLIREHCELNDLDVEEFFSKLDL